MAEQRTNRDVAQEGFKAFSEGRFEDCLATLDPEIEWHISFRLPDLPPDQHVARGHDEVRELWRRFTGVWEELVFDPEEFVHDAGDTVIVRIHVHGVGRESGVAVDRTLYYLLTVRDELLTRIVPFDTLAEAAAAGGIELPAS
jgi:ketosteroid isomerase-like protein